MKRPSHVAKRASKKERVVLKSALERPKKVGLRAKWCETCNQLKRDGPRHKFDFPSHALRPLVAAEREAYAEELSQDHEYKLDLDKLVQTFCNSTATSFADRLLIHPEQASAHTSHQIVQVCHVAF